MDASCINAYSLLFEVFSRNSDQNIKNKADHVALKLCELDPIRNKYWEYRRTLLKENKDNKNNKNNKNNDNKISEQKENEVEEKKTQEKQKHQRTTSSQA